jgi:hypothetical protein
MAMSMRSDIEVTTMRVTSLIWQKSAERLILIVVGGLGARMACSVLWPTTFPSADRFDMQSETQPLPMLIVAVGVIGLAVYLWWTTIRLELRLDRTGVFQTNGLRRTHTKWSDIASYTIETIGSHRDNADEPVLHGADGRVVLRPLWAPIVHDSVISDQRARFWKYVRRVIDNRN